MNFSSISSSLLSNVCDIHSYSLVSLHRRGMNIVYVRDGIYLLQEGRKKLVTNN